jgi:hypothetical protein
MPRSSCTRSSSPAWCWPAGTWPPELKFLTVSVLGVAFSFGLGAAVVPVPGVSHVI